jgi:hypothetical protein
MEGKLAIGTTKAASSDAMFSGAGSGLPAVLLLRDGRPARLRVAVGVAFIRGTPSFSRCAPRSSRSALNMCPIFEIAP